MAKVILYILLAISGGLLMSAIQTKHNIATYPLAEIFIIGFMTAMAIGVIERRADRG